MRTLFLVAVAAWGFVAGCSSSQAPSPDIIVLREPIYPRSQSQAWAIQCSRQTMTIELNDNDRAAPTISIDGRRVDTTNLIARLKAASRSDLFNLQFRGTACPENGATSFSVEATSYGEEGRTLFIRFYANLKNGVELWPEPVPSR